MRRDLIRLREIASEYKHAIDYREGSPYWEKLIYRGLCEKISFGDESFCKVAYNRFMGFLRFKGYRPEAFAFPVFFAYGFGIVYRKNYIWIDDVAKEVLQPRLDLLEEFIIELENGMSDETL